MADLVLGLAKSAVEGTLTVAKSAIEEEEKLKKSMQLDLMLISDEFEMMNSFLNVAKERATDEMVRTLVRQVRNMALDVEDCIESVMLVDTKPHWWRRLVPSCMLADAPAASLDDAVAAAELLKCRVEAMGQRNERYWHIRDSGSKPTAKTHQQAIADAAAVGILIEARNTKKRHGSPRDLVQLIKKKDHVLPLQMISLWGAVGDLGVASIIKKARDDPELCRKFKFRAWVKLTQPFNPHEFIRSLMAQFYTNCLSQQESIEQIGAMMTMEDTRLTEKFLKQVSNVRYIIFLEDVSSSVDWEAVRAYLPDKKNGSCIVVHTQQLEVASLVVGQSHRVLELEQFSADHSVCVFFDEKKRSSLRDLNEVINMKEQDLPLQVISVYGPLGNLGVESIIKKTCDGDHDPKICKNFRYRAWVKLMHPFNPHEFVRSLLAQLHTNYCSQHGSAVDFLNLNGMMMGTEGVLMDFAKQMMSKQKYIVFLEDLSSMDDWEAVREFLPDKKNGSCIVVHTQQLEVARLCVEQPHRVLELEQSSADHSVGVFYKEGDQDEERAIKTEAAREWLHECQLVGRQEDTSNICANGAGVQAVFGIAGVGKSYIVKHVYFKKVIEHEHFQKFGWVDVSHPFNIRDFSWSLLLDLHSGALQNGSMLRIRDPIQECRELLKGHTCLIVIDGLQSTEEWDSIKDALGFEHDNPSRIIVIASEESVATYCSKYWWNVEGLEIDEALDLFKRTASKAKSLWPSNPSPADIEKAKLVLHKCGGLPKVIVAVADFASAGSLLRINWDYFMPVLENYQAFVSLRDLFSWVHSYFHSCPDSLKPCIFYLSIFPANHKIRRRRLVRRWIAEGYSMDTKESTAEEKGEESFLDLCKRNMIQVPGSTSLSYLMRMPLCQVNGFLREYIISRSMEENLVFALEGHCNVNSQHNGRHLTIGSTWDRDMSVYQSIDFSRLRSLTVFGKWESFFISDKMRIVRVLDLEDASSVTDADLDQMVKLLPRLKFLSLRGCKEITRLPDSFGELRQLQTLDIRHTSVVTLPPSITNLQKLQQIRAGTTVLLDDDSSTVESLPPPPPEAASASSLMSRRRAATLVSQLRLLELWTRRSERFRGSRNGGIEVPRGIGKMMALYTISVIDISVASRWATLEELKNLTQLRKLGVSGVNRENCQELCSAISDHAHLKSLSVWLDNNQASSLDAITTPPENLQSLKLYGHVNKLPSWIKLQSNLKKLKLQLTMITQADVDLLKDLPSLHTLCLCFKEFEYGELRFRGNRCFRRLRVLEIACNFRLQSVTFQHSVMCGLKVLKISCNNVSDLMFSKLKDLKDLREVSLSGSYDDKVKQHLQSQLAKHPREMKPVLKEAPGSL
ncbi:unnamed protein product [Urochloa decumbens]|uniref:Uncharacterized protein n=1 Tax=Urochloa decumbens TaxID=240449 RepID=A0ABC9AVS8_9POAL